MSIPTRLATRSRRVLRVGSAGENVRFLLRQFGKNRMVQSNENFDYTCDYEDH